MMDRTDREHGAISVLVAILMVVLLGFAAIAVDVAMLYSERAQLQNGSDAAALMVAQKCAKANGAGSPDCSSTSPLAPILASGNAVDRKSNVKSIVLGNRTVTVTAAPLENGGAPNRVSLFFARALGFDSAEVDAKSTVQWGSPAKGTTPFPLAFSVCQVSTTIGTGPQLLEAHNSSDKTDKGTPDCVYAGKPVPGGFNWTHQTSGICGSSIDLSVSLSYSETGNDAPDNCGPTLNGWAESISANKDVVVLLPVFDSANGTGSSASYHLTAFAAFKIQGWKFSGPEKLPFVFHNAPGSGLDCTGSCRGIIGSFIKYVSLSDGYTLGPVSPFGATVVELTN